MSDSIDEERQRIREQKKRELQQRLENGDVPGEGSAEASAEAPSEPIEIEGAGHLESVVDSYPIVLVDCYADWCGPCQMLEPTIDALAAETDAAVAKVDVDANQPLAQQLGARGVPTLVLYADGEPVERTSGVQPREALKQWITSYK
ncbi:thioredoxin family protein [Natrarchaeobaculum sulfurireducens]|uniref:Thiol-disulfide isomerase n=1 Tax=Natrarchaeobaculum sulfurireducens TaxID=2044521 RepID=A0A346PCZ3_9EURY|nr:thioredoxin family protein [Natrarchaeobaculum sulfurireducens]AXR77388.1 Thiol-disulfide isomerase [Natrarchaeobaculum sulfurireducens]